VSRATVAAPIPLAAPVTAKFSEAMVNSIGWEG
jgi:hypothetical protein